ncbi:MAG TPA: carboxypeptidase-like regulatory domain-containing protein [Solirubrobacteraceae bacterium]|nr:carboxypeptidase-like regulatory domain-containing protein [Solirubrobacteraceae bacterium]
MPVIAAAAIAAAPAAALADTITGTVTDSNGASLSGATVTATDQTTPGAPVVATTASDGTYTLSGLTTGDNYDVEFSDSGYVTQWYNDEPAAYLADEVAAPHTGVNAALVTAPTGGISGTVSGPSGGANVEIDIVDASGSCPTNAVTCSTDTDSNGNFTLSGLPNGTYFLEASTVQGTGQNYVARWYGGGSSASTATAVTVSNGQVTGGVGFSMTPGGVVTGQVTDPQAGGAAVGSGDVEVTAVTPDGNYYAESATDANGNYILAGLPTGTYKIDFGGSGFLSEFYGGTASAQSATPVAVTAGAISPVNMSLPEDSQGGTITGSVTNAATGASVGGVEVELFDSANNPVASDYYGGQYATQTSSDGSFSLTGLLPGTYKVEFVPQSGNLAYQFYSGQTSLATANTVTVGAGQTVPGVNAGLSAGGSISGTVTAKASGAGVADASVYLEDGAGDTLDSTTTGPDGTYTLGGIPSGAGYHVEFDTPSSQLPGGGFYETQWWNDSLTFGSSQTVPVTAGANTAGINAALSTYASTTTPVQVVTTPPPAPKPGKPTLSHSSLKGLSKHKATLKFTVTSGKNGAPEVKSMAVSLPKGLSFVAKKLKRGIKVSGGGKYTAKLRHGILTITLKKPAHKVTLTASSGSLQVSRTLAKDASAHKDKTVRVQVRVTNASHKTSKLALTFHRPK